MVVVVTVAGVAVVGRAATVGGRAVPDFATDRFGGRAVTTGEALVWNSPNHSSGPATSRHNSGPRANFRMRRSVRRLRRANHSKRVIDGSKCSCGFITAKIVAPRRTNCHAAITAA